MRVTYQVTMVTFLVFALFSIFPIAHLSEFGLIPVAYAQGDSDSIGNNPSNPGTLGNNPSNPGTLGNNPGGSNGSGGLTNPLKANTVTELFFGILDILLIFAVPIIVFFIMWAGYLYVTAQGDEGKLKTAHLALTYAIVGGVLILGAKLVIEIIQATINSI